MQRLAVLGLLVLCLAYAGANNLESKLSELSLPEHFDQVYCLYWTNCTEECGGGKRSCPRSNGKTMSIDCHLQDCEEIEDCGTADIVFVLDDSTSIGERNYWITKQFTIDVMKGLNISPDHTRIGMVTYSDVAHTWWQLDGYGDEFALEEAIWDLPKQGGVTNTADGLLHAQQIFEQSGRASVKHIVVIITDGESNVQKDRTIPQAEEMHSDIEIFAIGIGNINEAELEGIASEIKSEHWHHVPDYHALVKITSIVINETCTAMSPNKTECDEWSAWGPCEVRDGGCGDGNHTRERECRFYKYEGDPDPAIRIDKEFKPCHIACPDTTPAPPPYCLNWTECDAPCGKIGRRVCQRSNGRIWRIPCYGGRCEEVECAEADVILILDSSNSIGGRQWYGAKQFAIDVVNGLPLDTEDIWVATVTFSNAATTEWSLGDFRTAERIEEMLWALPWAAGVTNSQDGLNHASDVVRSSSRQDVKKIAIFLSDGESNVHQDRTIPAAEALKNLGVKVFSIAVRKAGIDELKAVASDPDDYYYHQIDDYDTISTIVETIIDETCQEAIKR